MTSMGYRQSSGPAGIIASAPRVNGGPQQHTTHQIPQYGNIDVSRYGLLSMHNGTQKNTAVIQRGGRSYSIGSSSRAAVKPKTPLDAWQGRQEESRMYINRASTPGRSRMGMTSSSYRIQNEIIKDTGIHTRHMNPAATRPVRQQRVTLILDLDETLVHSSFDPVLADLHIPLVMDGEHYVAYVNKRPFVEEFLRKCTQLFDVIVWTASLSVYAEPLINELSRMARIGNLKKMYREHCTEVAGGGYVKDLSTLGMSLEDVCIIDNSPSVSLFQPKNYVAIQSWYECRNDTALKQMIPFLEKLSDCRSVTDVIPQLSSFMDGSNVVQRWTP